MTSNCQSSNADVQRRVTEWLVRVIIGLNFCPFAKKEFERDSLRYIVSEASQPNQALEHLLDELSLLDRDQQVETTLLIFSTGFVEFDEYLDMLEMANALIEQGGYSGIYQLASFHPCYCFEGEDPSDPANFTNRSPYPILHILREASIERVLKRYPKPEKIPENNIQKARQLGASFIQNLIFPAGS